MRLQYGIRAWTEALEHEGKQMEDMDLSMDTDAPTTATHKPGGEPKFKVRKIIFDTMRSYLCTRNDFM